ncbi:tumor necrosis factor receptor superfamily member 18 [Melanotaenia boesemani]|uniref:tumor necrosis factor receptor superfamily member 18 n=1 Tax=Melanotaenia boesemani TaxID=1250792 RepID=UPI001C047D33|nr:tumor necrosis factor receptor superfamily member 18 [Melanotaenia boesemani]
MSRAVFTMYFSFLLLGVLSVWTIGQAIEHDCSAGQTKINGRCCNKCPPGTFLKEFCSDTKQTVCYPCAEGKYSAIHHVFDQCEDCQSCEQEYSEKCTSTTKGNCACRAGFLCSNNICSKCQKNECTIWENPIRTENLDSYSYHCEPKCREQEYFDVSNNNCKPWTNCSDVGLAERIPGNKTRNPVCYETPTHKNQDFIRVSLCIGFVLCSLSLFIFMSYICAKNLRKHKANKKPHPVAFCKSSNFPLSKEESGFQDDSKDSNSSGQPSLEKVLFL